ncbi:MAG: hypothetical protein R2719_03035 [Micropruina sp.]
MLVPLDPVGLSAQERAEVAQWDADLDALALAAVEQVTPGRPEYLSVTGVVRLARDPETFVADAGRPMPQRPIAAQRLGTRFHRWIEDRFSLAPTFDVDPGQEPPDDPYFARLSAAFERGQFASRRPSAVEVPFSMLVAGTIVRGRIEPCSPPTTATWWSTGRPATCTGPTRRSWRSTGRHGPTWSASRPRRCRPRSSTSSPTAW